MALVDEIRQLLTDFWEEQSLEAIPDGDISVDNLAPPLDSMAAVEVLVMLDKLLGKELPSSVIKPGGYENREEFVTELTEKVMQTCGELV